MTVLLVVDSPKTWPLSIPGAELVSAKAYLTEPRFADLSGAKVFNLCRSYRYQTTGYYVSLLAGARGHKPLPSVGTLQDFRLASVLRIASNDLDELIQKSLHDLKGGGFELSIYFGKNLAAKHERLAQALFNQFPAPFLRVGFTREDGAWSIEQARIIGAGEIPDEHKPFVIEQAQRYFAKPPRARKAKAAARFDLAILHDGSDAMGPSDARALAKFVDAAEELGIRAELIEKDAYGRIAEFDALFIRATTSVDHYTYRFSRRAKAEGLVVIDEPDAILKCTNKVYLAELLERHRVPTPLTVIFGEDNAGLVAERIGFPCVIKQPDSSFSVGVVKVDTAGEFSAQLASLFEKSELLVAQEFVPTEFDWRIGVLDGEPLYACKYFMARKHWQIYKRDEKGVHSGKGETVPVTEAPRPVVQAAVKAARLIGDGLFGVDLKVLDGKPKVIEVNDNPSLDSGVEDRVLGDFLYERVMRSFLARLEERRR